MPPTTPFFCGTILVVGPQKALATKIQDSLTRRGHDVTPCQNTSDALNLLAKREFDLIIIDEGLGKAFEVALVGQIQARGMKEEIVVTSFMAAKPEGHESSNRPEPRFAELSELNELSRTVEVALERRQLHLASHDEFATVNGAGNGNAQGKSPGLIGRSPVMRQLFRTIARIAPIESNVLITGATGTGKELVARAIHDLSPRRHQPFVDVNSSAIPDTLFETEFFGHQRGTFTGAYETRLGLFERASGGTIFLDEVDTLNLAAQAKLLRVLQERHLRRLGGRENISVDVRIIAATSTNLKAATATGIFRPDLYFRLRVVPLHVPELRERVEDIELLVDYFLRRNAERSGKTPLRFNREAMRVLTDYPWPGNVRELENVIEYAIAMVTGDELGIDDLPPDMFGEDMQDGVANVIHISSNASLAEVERRHILSVFDRCGRHHIKTAAALRIDRRTLYRKLQQYNLELELNSA